MVGSVFGDWYEYSWLLAFINDSYALCMIPKSLIFDTWDQEKSIVYDLSNNQNLI